VNETTRHIVAALMSKGRFRRAYLGIAGGPRPVPPRFASNLGARTAVEVVEVVDGSPAEAAGLLPEDLIVELGGRRTEGAGDLQRLMTEDLIGESVIARVIRRGELIELTVVPAELES